MRERGRESATLNSENRRAIKSTLKKEKRATTKNERETLDFGASSSFVFSLRLREEDVADFEEGPTNSAYGQSSTICDRSDSRLYLGSKNFS